MSQLVHDIKVKKKWASRIKRYINEMSFDEVYEEVLKFANWESEREYHPSRIFIYIWEFFQIYGKEVDSAIWEWFEYRDFTMKRTITNEGFDQFETFELYCKEEPIIKVQWRIRE
jgi:hypothetical protein